jgi:hypothetical protein
MGAFIARQLEGAYPYRLKPFNGESYLKKLLNKGLYFFGEAGLLIIRMQKIT